MDWKRLRIIEPLEKATFLPVELLIGHGGSQVLWVLIGCAGP